MNRFADWIKGHQIAAFFIIAITWTVFILIYFVFPGNPLIKVLVGDPIGVFSPALAAMSLTLARRFHVPRLWRARWVSRR